MPDDRLLNQAVLVVGGSSGIGFATARAARAAGAIVTIASRSADRLAQASEKLDGLEALEMDVTDEASVIAALAGNPAYDHVVVTPGSVAPLKVRGGTAAAAMPGFDAKFWGAYRIAAHAGIRNGGSLTLISGVYALRPAKGHVVGACVNAAVDALARALALALELAPVRVNAISPGLVDTPLWSSMPEVRRDAMFSAAAGALPAGRTGTADDVAALVLACMTNPMLTGSIIVADGGHVLV